MSPLELVAVAALALPTLATLQVWLGTLAQRVQALVVAWVFDRKIVTDKMTAEVLLAYLSRHGRPLRLAHEGIDAAMHPIRGEENDRYVFWRKTHMTYGVFLYRSALIFYFPTYMGPGIDDVEEHVPKGYASFYSLRWTVAWPALMTTAARAADVAADLTRGARGSRFLINRFSGTLNDPTSKIGSEVPPDNSTGSPEFSYGSTMPINYPIEAIGQEPDEAPLSHLAITPSMQRIMDTIRFWFRSRRWYQDHKIPWKFGLGIYGLRGSGKTSLARAIAQDLGIPLHIFDLATMTTKDFRKAWKASSEDDVRMVLMEDFDTVFHGRENQQGPQAVSFGALLEAIDGVEPDDGTLLVITTNHLEHLDPALGNLDSEGQPTRPGRLTAVLDLPPMGEAQRIFIARRILHDELAARRVVAEHPDDSPDQLTQRCIKIALEDLWGSRKEAA